MYVGHEISVAVLEAGLNNAVSNIGSGPVVKRDHGLVGLWHLEMDAVDFPANPLFRPAAGPARSEQAPYSNLQTEIAFANLAPKLVAAATVCGPQTCGLLHRLSSNGGIGDHFPTPTRSC
jgi:hypothetical protein